MRASIGNQKNQRKPLTALAIIFIDNAAIAMILPLLPILSADAGGEPGDWIYIVVINALAILISPYFWGKVITFRNTEIVISSTLFIKSLCLLILILDPSWQVLAFSRLASGLMTGTPIALQAMLFSSRKNLGASNREMAVAVGFFTSLGSTVGPILTGLFLSKFFDTKALISAFAFAQILIGAAFLLLNSEPTRDYAEKNSCTLNRSLPKVGSTRFVLLVSGVTRLLISAFPVLVLAHAEARAGSSEITIAQASFLISVIGIVEVLLHISAPKILKLVPVDHVITWSSASIFVAFSALSISEGVHASMGAAIAIGTASTMIRSSVLDLLAREIPETRTRVFGANLTVMAGARTLAPILVGTTVNTGVSNPFLLFAVISALSAVSFYCLGKNLPDDIKEEENV